jgi:HK97 family phage portal protein
VNVFTTVASLLADALGIRNQAPILGGPSYGPTYGGLAGSASFQNTVRAWQSNEILAAGLNLLASSAAEPHIIGRRYRRNKRQIRAESRRLKAYGLSNRAGSRNIDAVLIRNGFWEEVDDVHPAVWLVNHPNPYTSRGQFWSSILMDRYLAGNGYALKARYQSGILAGTVAELWRLRPDRVRPVPGNMAAGEPFIKAYEYRVGSEMQTFDAADILHFKAPNPLDAYTGAPPLLPIMDRITIDQYMRNFLRTFFERGGAGVGAMLNIKNGKLNQQEKDDMRDRFRRMFGSGVYDILISSAEDMQYTPFGLNRGLRDALPKEIDAVTEARIAMVLAIPGSILGLLIGYETSSYANQRIAWSVFWDITMTPLLSDFDDVLNLGLVNEFGNIDELVFDLSDIRALQEDEDALQERARKNVDSGLWTIEEGRAGTGVQGMPNDGEHILLPTRSTLVTTPIPDEAPVNPPPLAKPAPVALLEEPHRGRPRLEEDPEARGIWLEVQVLRDRYPDMTWAQISNQVGRSERQLREYRVRFAEE